jgi:hypothetical protein
MAMDRVIIGAVPHKLPVTIEARDNREILRATGQFATGGLSYRQLLQVAWLWPERIWAVEGANGIGRPLTQRLLASGERVLDVPAKLAARARVSGTRQGRKTDATDAHDRHGRPAGRGTARGQHRSGADGAADAAAAATSCPAPARRLSAGCTACSPDCFRAGRR